MEIDTNALSKDMTQIKRDLELIKNVLISEGELTDWARNSLDEARNEDESKYTDLEDL